MHVFKHISPQPQAIHWAAAYCGAGEVFAHIFTQTGTNTHPYYGQSIKLLLAELLARCLHIHTLNMDN